MEALSQFRTPDVYRTNLFRVLGIAIDATARDVRRQVDKWRIAAKFSSEASGTAKPPGPLSLPVPVTEEQVKAAHEQFQNPVSRFLSEVFWFWPTGERPDPALVALGGGDIDAATREWANLASGGSPTAKALAEHNLAVFYHLMALDAEAGLASGRLQARQVSLLQTYWQRSLGHWRRTCVNPEFLVAMAARAAAHEDVRLSDRLVEETLDSLPALLLGINARLAVAAADAGDQASAKRHLRLLAESPFDVAIQDAALREVVKPAEEKLKHAIDSALAEWTRTPQQGNRHVRAMHATCVQQLGIIDLVLGDSRFAALRGSLHDLVADAMLDGQIAFGNKTNEWLESIALLELAKQVVTGEVIRNRLIENIAILSSNEKAGNDWCAPGYWEMPEEMIAKFESARLRTRTGDFDGALAILVPLPITGIEVPLRRAVAYCLSVSATRIINAAIDEFNEETPTQKRLWTKIVARGGRYASAPTPSTPQFMMPECPLCGSSYYTQWSVFNLRDNNLWFCGSCASTNRQEIDSQKQVLKNHYRAAIERLILATEVDKHEDKIRKDLKHLQERAEKLEFGLASLSSTDLKRRLDPSIDTPQIVPFSIQNNGSEFVCHFCGENIENGMWDANIRLPVCSSPTTIERILGRSSTVLIAEMRVTRCGSCSMAHASRVKAHHAWEAECQDVTNGVRGINPTLTRLRARLPLVVLAVYFLTLIAGGYLGVPELLNMLSIKQWILPFAISPLCSGAAAGLIYWLHLREQRGFAARTSAAIAKFEMTNPPPQLPEGIRPEAAWRDFPKLATMLQQGWSLGRTYDPKRREPDEIHGLHAKA